MLSTIFFIILFAININWMISLSLVAFTSQEKNVRIRSAILCSLSGILLGYLVYLI